MKARTRALRSARNGDLQIARSISKARRDMQRTNADVAVYAPEKPADDITSKDKQ